MKFEVNDSKRLLVVEDSSDLQELIRALFELEGYQVHCVSNGAEALEFLSAAEVLPQIILLDLMMPIMDGFEFRKAQLADPKISGIPTIVMTADGNVKIKGSPLGDVDYLRKPAEINEILDVVQRNAERIV